MFNRYTIHHNVIRDTTFASIKVHYGHNNTIYNNIFVNSTYEGQIGGTGTTHYNTSSNRFFNNVVWFNGSYPIRALQGSLEKPWFSEFNRNLYYNPTVNLSTSNTKQTPLGPFTNWTRGGYDTQSILDQDPGFADMQSGNLCLGEDSPAFDLPGFNGIPESVCQC